MKKLTKILLSVCLLFSLFGCVQDLEIEKENRKKEHPEEKETKEGDKAQENSFFLENERLQTIYHSLQNAFVEHYIVVNSATVQGNVLTYSLANSYSLLQFTYQNEQDNSSICIIENNDENLDFEKEACISASDPSLYAIASTILHIVKEKGSFDILGNTYAQEGNVFTITLNTNEKKNYESAMQAALSTYKNVKCEDKDRLQLILHAYAYKQAEKFNSILVEENSTNVSNFTNQTLRFLSFDQVELSYSHGKPKVLSYRDKWGSFVVEENQTSQYCLEENKIDENDTMISRLCLNQISGINSLKQDDSLKIMITPTNTTIFITLESDSYKETIILAEEEMQVTQTQNNQSIQYFYTFENMDTIASIMEEIKTKSFSFEEAFERLKKWI
ncbi:MAG: hypothetical protein Q4C49_05595 [Bacillota bacterium]|nr:hypothetical protein [Bacillota bacterium]